MVDEHITPIDAFFDNLYTGKGIAEYWLSEEQIPIDVQHIIATSFSKENNLKSMGKDAFYRSIVEAYANHLSVTLSPDMIWLVISQGFARYVNAHTEELRPKLVSHTDKMDLVIETGKIGWLVRISQDEKDMLNQLKKDNENGWIHLRVQEVPIMLSELGRIKSLHLVFTGRVMLPDWMDKLTIDRLTIEGNMTDPEKAYIKERFPNVRLLDSTNTIRK